MNEAVVLTPERILEVTEDVLRRFGLAKATVVDVARALDVSHGSVYRHFPSKASLRDAVAKRWLDRANAPLQKIAEGSGPAPGRLERWLRAMFAIKYKKVCDDPEMFATYLALAQEARDVVKAHKERLVDQIAQKGLLRIIEGLLELRSLQAASSRRGLGQVISNQRFSRLVFGLQNDVAVDPRNNLIDCFRLCQAAGSNQKDDCSK